MKKLPVGIGIVSYDQVVGVFSINGGIHGVRSYQMLKDNTVKI